MTINISFTIEPWQFWLAVFVAYVVGGRIMANIARLSGASPDSIGGLVLFWPIVASIFVVITPIVIVTELMGLSDRPAKKADEKPKPEHHP